MAGPRTSRLGLSRLKLRHWRVPIWLALMLAFGGLTIATATVIGTGFYITAVDNTLNLALDLGDAELSRINGTVEAQLQPAADQSRFLADYISRGHVSPSDQKRLRDLLLGSVGAVRQVSGVAFVRPNFNMVWASVVAQGRPYLAQSENVSGNPEVVALMARARKERVPFWAGPLILGEGGPLMIAVAPVSDENDRFVGIVGAAVSLRAASIRLAALATDERVPFVATENGSIVMHPSNRVAESLAKPTAELPPITGDIDPVLAALPWPPKDTLAADVKDRPANVNVTTATADGMDYLVVFRRITGYGAQPWYIGYRLPQSWAEDALEAVNRAIPFAAGMVGFAVLVAFFIGRAIGKPIYSLAESARRIAQLDLEAKPVRGSRLRELHVAAEAQAAMRNGLVWLNNYIPRTLAPVLLKSGEEMMSRERDIVVLFTDIVGFSGIAEGRTAERVAALLNRHFALLGAVIEEEGGTIDKYIGDSIMAFWGAPLPQDDRAERAVRAAIAIGRKLQADNVRRAGKDLKPLRIRMGLHQGPALVGNIGAPGRINYTLIGDTVNVAQRLEQFGRDVDDGTTDAIIVISAELAAHLPPGIVSADLGEHMLPGRSSPEHLYQIKPE